MPAMDDEQFATAALALRHAKQSVDGPTELSRRLTEKTGEDISRQAVSGWTTVPEKWVEAVEAVTGVHRAQLRPDRFSFRDNN